MLRLAAALALFFVSGFAALLYQVIWQRLLVFFSGADVHSATIVVAAFMAGLGCGSFAGGQLADRVRQTTSLALFAAAELSVAAFGFFSTFFFYDLLYLRLGHVDIGTVPTALSLFAALLWPTFFMGASLPLLARGLTSDIGRAASTIGLLYALNTAGAAVGAFAATWVLLPQLGLDGSVRSAAFLNLGCAMAAVPLAMAGRRAAAPPLTHTDPSVVGARPDEPDAECFARWSALFAVSGFVGLSLEIIWFRLLGVMLKSTAFTFGTLLAIYLAGLAAGSVAGSALAATVRRPARWFLFLQAGAGVYAAASLAVFVWAVGDAGALQWFREYFRQYDGVDVRGSIAALMGLASGGGADQAAALRLYVLLPMALIGPPTVMAGMSFPLLQRVVQTDLRLVGRRVGLLLTSNVLGSTAGAFVTGLLLLDWFGTAGTLKLIFVISASFAAVAIAGFRLDSRWRRALLMATALVVAAGVWRMPEGQLLWARLHGTSSPLIILGEDGSGLSVLRGERIDFRRTVVYVNGLGQSWIPYGDIHTILGALPAFFHERPRRAALIGLGSGDTLFAMSGRADLEQITSIEIIEPQLDTLRRLAAWQGYPGLLRILEDPRIRHVHGDGRRFLARESGRYDIIQADALRPHSAYAGNLYSESYFGLLRERLEPGGMAVTWAPTERIVRTFMRVFPYVALHGQVAIGTAEPISLDARAMLGRLRERATADYYSAAGINIEALLAPYASGWRIVGPHDERPTGDINTDLHPRDEFDIPDLVDLSFVTGE